MQLPTPFKLILIIVLAFVGFVFGPIVEYIQERSRQRRNERD